MTSRYGLISYLNCKMSSLRTFLIILASDFLRFVIGIFKVLEFLCCKYEGVERLISWNVGVLCILWRLLVLFLTVLNTFFFTDLGFLFKSFLNYSIYNLKESFSCFSLFSLLNFLLAVLTKFMNFLALAGS